MDVYCHEYCTSTVTSGQVYLSFVRKWMFIAMSTVPVLLHLDKFICLSLGNGRLLPWVLYQYSPSGQVYLSFVRKWMFIAMSTVPVLFLLDKFICLLDWSVLRPRHLRKRLLVGSNTTCPLEHSLKQFLSLWRWCLPKLWQCLTAY